jgi:uncharacterized protein (TIGR03435 family)
VVVRLLNDSREKVESVAPALQATALLHIARVLTTIDRAEAERVLERGLSVIEGLPARDRHDLHMCSVSIAATIVPSRALSLARQAPDEWSRASAISKAVFEMVSHGHLADAVAYLTDPAPGDPYPFMAVTQVMGQSHDDGTRLRLFRGALRAMRNLREHARTSRDSFGGPDELASLFNRSWKLLPSVEARAAVRELVESILSEPDQRMNGRIEGARFSSSRELRLFDLLGPLQELDPDLAQSLIRRHPQLASAAARLPRGIESMMGSMAVSPTVPAQLERTRREEFDVVGSGPHLVSMTEALRTDFREPFEIAAELYANDLDPDEGNGAPRECWPSTHAFRNIVHKAAEYEGAAAVRHLDRMPDRDLRLLAQIELSAALAGLPLLGGQTIGPGRRELSEEHSAVARTSDGLPEDLPEELMATIRAMREPLPPPRRPDLPPSFEVRISPTSRRDDQSVAGGCGADFWAIEGAALRDVLPHLYETPGLRIEWPLSIDLDARYDFALVLPEEIDGERMRGLMREGIASHFHLRITREVRLKDVYVLTAPDAIRARQVRESIAAFGGIESMTMEWTETAVSDRPRGRRPDALRLAQVMELAMAGSNVQGSAGEHTQKSWPHLGLPVAHTGAQLIGIHASLTMAELCGALESALDHPVVDDTGLTATYQIRASGGKTTLEFLDVLRDKVGVIVTPARRGVPMLVIRVGDGPGSMA